MASIINSLYWNTGYFGYNKLVTSYLHGKSFYKLKLPRVENLNALIVCTGKV
ncbi:MAG: hypothetical protein RL517_1542 [Pseudomonadota bacterium]